MILIAIYKDRTSALKKKKGIKNFPNEVKDNMKSKILS